MDESDSLTVWGFEVPRELVTETDYRYLADLRTDVPSVEWVWAEMDRIWQSLGLDNTKPLSGQPIDQFYEHPVWIMNGIFTSVDPESATHRRAIAAHISGLSPSSVADYGGGFGELALEIGDACPSADVSIIEPHPFELAKYRLKDRSNIGYTAKPEPHSIDVLVAQDVLEHVEDPIQLAIELVGLARPGGSIVFANHFAPAILCHLPQTFHLLRTFPWVMRSLGLSYRGRIPGAPHAQSYIVPNAIRANRAKVADRASRRVEVAVRTARGLRKVAGAHRPA